jgi:site-specific DNA-methyltransferase (adenine-specific)
MKPEPKQRGDAACMIVFCSFEQQWGLIELAQKFGINNYINLVFRKNFSAQVLKANMRVVGNAEYALLLYRDKLPKVRNEGKMVFNVMDWLQDDQSSPLYRKVHPTQKPVRLMERLVEIFTDPGDVVIDPVAGSGSTLLAAYNQGRRAYGFEIDRKLHGQAQDWLDFNLTVGKELTASGFSQTLAREQFPNQPSLFEVTQ